MTRTSIALPQDVFQIGSTSFSFSADSKVIFEDGGMRFDFKAEPQPERGTLGQEALRAWDGSAAPHLWSSGLFHFDDRAGDPHQVFSYPHTDPDSPFHLYVQGVAYGLRFFGQVELTPDRIALHGVLRQEHHDDIQGTPLHLVRHFPRGEVRPKPRHFHSLKAAQAVPAGTVRHLTLRQQWRPETPRTDRFPEEVLAFTAIESLILDYASTDHARFTELPEAIGTLQQLTRLDLSNTSVQHLPDAIGKLRQLRHLAMSPGMLTSVSERIAQLPHLERLDLAYNQLTTLPEAIGHMPSLKALKLSGNAFTSLPASIDRIENLQVDVRYLPLFRDMRYRPEIEVATSAESFLASSSPAHVAMLHAGLARHGLLDHEPVLLRHTRQALRWRTTEPDAPPVLGGTRFGGAPDLPPGLPYPTTDGKPWHFYAQLDLDALAVLQCWLPRTGRLYFFAKSQDPSDGVRVLHDTSPRSALVPHAWGSQVDSVDDIDVPRAYKGYRAVVDATVSLPILYNGHERYTGEDAGLMEIYRDDALSDTYAELADELSFSPDKLHGVHLQNAFVFTQHESPEEQSVALQRGSPGEWVNLLRLGSDQHPGFEFGDAGTLTFTIHRKDLALGDFSRVLAFIES
ncbi:DUF1963 domain-containing protein [Acidovorax sp.]|uniref:DUF1963 domain-containing protein n=1 Tax=Acidovorax sp. TaxID=1872122 RepID=UPI00391F794D